MIPRRGHLIIADDPVRLLCGIPYNKGVRATYLPVFVSCKTCKKILRELDKNEKV